MCTGNFFRASFHTLDVVITNTTEQVTKCTFVAGILVGQGDPDPKWHWQTASESRARRDGEGASFGIDLVDDPLTKKKYEGKLLTQSPFCPLGQVTFLPVGLISKNSKGLAKQQDGLVEKISAVRVYFFIKGANLGEVWRFSEVSRPFSRLFLQALTESRSSSVHDALVCL